MSIQSFVDSAKILYDNKKYDESLCLVCIAIDACSAKKFPNKRNAERYKLFLKKYFCIICRYGFIEIEASNIRIKVNVPNIALKPDKDNYVLFKATNIEAARKMKNNLVNQYSELYPNMTDCLDEGFEDAFQYCAIEETNYARLKSTNQLE